MLHSAVCKNGDFWAQPHWIYCYYTIFITYKGYIIWRLQSYVYSTIPLGPQMTCFLHTPVSRLEIVWLDRPANRGSEAVHQTVPSSPRGQWISLSGRGSIRPWINQAMDQLNIMDQSFSQWISLYSSYILRCLHRRSKYLYC